MRAIIKNKEGHHELNWMWMPSFIGHNRRLKMKMDEKLSEHLVGKTLDQCHELILDWIQAEFPRITGLRQYLSGLAHVEDVDGG